MMLTIALFFGLTHWVSQWMPTTTGIAKHEFHVSRSEINYDTQSASFQVTIHVFIDDLEKALDSSGKSKLKLGTQAEAPNADQLIGQYLESRHTISLKGKKMQAEFLGKEWSEDMIAFYCYLEYPVSGTVSEVAIKNNILTELFDDQKNLVSVTKNKKRIASFLFDKEQNSDIVRF